MNIKDTPWNVVTGMVAAYIALKGLKSLCSQLNRLVCPDVQPIPVKTVIPRRSSVARVLR